jgi:hypothetical protein
LCKFSQNVLQKYRLREIDIYDFVVVGPSGLLTVGTPPRCEAPRHIPPAWTTNQYLPIGSVKGYPEMSGILVSEACFRFYKKMAAKFGF